MRTTSILSIFAIIILLNVKSSSSTNPLTVKGSFKNTKFRNVGTFLTFNIYSTSSISDSNVQVHPRRNESIQGFNSKGNEDIEFLPVKVYEKLPNLIAYHVKESSIRNIEYKHFEKLKELEIIFLNDNQIQHITNDAFKDLTKLKYLDLDENLLVDICFIHSITSLWMVDFTGNQIVNIQSDAFEHLTELRNVSLQINKLSSFDNNYFEHNKKLEFIWLRNNQFRSVNPVNFDDKSNLIYVDLRGNVCINDYYRNFTEMQIEINKSCVQNIDVAAENSKCH